MSTHVSDIVPRLWFNGQRGIAHHAGVSVELHVAPVIGRAIVVQEIDFAPSLRVSQLRESGQAWRDMTCAERAIALALLVRISDAAHGAATVKDCLTVGASA